MAMFLKVAFSAAECLPIMAWTCFHNGIGLCPRMLYPKVHCANGINFGYTLRRAIYFCCCCFFSRQVLDFFGGSWFYAFLLLCFPRFSVFLLLCFCAFLFYYSTFSFLQSCVFAALLPAPLLLCFLSLLPLCFFFSFALFSPVCKHPRWNPKKP